MAGPAAGSGVMSRTSSEGTSMTGKADFTAEEWQLVLQGPPTGGMIVVTAQRGGTFRETLSIAAYEENPWKGVLLGARKGAPKKAR